MNKKPFYQIEEIDEKALFENSIIFFDTSSLLDMYYFTDENLVELESKLFNSLKERLWITYQSEFEFLKNKEKVKLKPVDSYNSLLNKIKGNSDSGHIEEMQNSLKSIENSLSNTLKGHIKTIREKVSKNNKHPYLEEAPFSVFDIHLLDFEKHLLDFKTKFELLKEELIKNIDSQKETFSDLENDKILPLVEKYFRVTNEPSFNELSQYVEEGEFRYKNTLPPGYLDNDQKIGFQKYGDLIVWKEIIRYAQEVQKDIILVINDVKEDWWYIDNKKNIAPRYELIKEFKDIVNSKFWMYEIGDFLYKANKYISTSIKDETIEDIIAIYEKSTPSSEIILSANREIDEPWRIDRLRNAAEFYCKNVTEINISKLFDHKGFLTVSWIKEPTNSEMKTIELAWVNEDELKENVEHIMP